MIPHTRAVLVAVALFIAAFGAYLYTMVPSMTGDDSGELVAVGATLGTAHSPGYPLYCLVTKAAVTLVPWSSPAYRVNLVSALFIAFAVVVIFGALLEIGVPMTAAAALSLAFAFSKNVWAMANVTEVYGLAAFVVCGIALVIFSSASIPSILAAAYLFGIGLAAHYTVGLLLPGLLLWVYMAARGTGAAKIERVAVYIFISAMCGFSLVAYLYIRARAGAAISWEDPQTLERFWQVVARLRYGSMALAQGGAPPLDPAIIIKKIGFFFAVLADNFTWAGVALFVMGCAAWARDRARGWPVFLMLLCSGPGFLILANVGLDKSSEALLERFFFLSFIFVVLVMGRGIRMLPSPLPVFSVLLPVFLLAGNISSLNHRQEFIFRDYAKNILRSLPPGSLVFSDRADEMEFCVASLRAAEGLRPDIDFTDCNAGISHSIYGNDYYRIWGKPRLERRLAVEGAAIARAGRPVYYATFDPRMIDIPRVQEGLVFRAKPGGPAGSRFPYGEICVLRIPETATMDDRGMSLLLSHFQLMGQYELDKDNSDAAERNFRGLAAYDGSGRWTSHIAFLYHQKGLLPRAEAYYRRAIAAGRGTVDLYTNLGAICETLGKRGEARAMYAQALKLDPAYVQAHYNLAVLNWKESDWRGVVEEFDRVLAADPGHREARYYRDAALRRMRP